MAKVSPYNGYKFKESPSSNVFYSRTNTSKSLYIPEYDNPTYHNVLTNMRNSFNYVKNDHHFDEKFLSHLKKTGFDDMGLICLKEYLKEKDKQRKQFGSGEDSVIRYPFDKIKEVIKDIEGEDGGNVAKGGELFDSFVDIQDGNPPEKRREEEFEEERKYEIIDNLPRKQK